MRFGTIATLALASATVINGSVLPVDNSQLLQIEERGILSGLVGKIGCTIGAILGTVDAKIQVVGSIVSDVFGKIHYVKSKILGKIAGKIDFVITGVLQKVDKKVNLLECLVDGLLKKNPAPNTNGIKWYEDVGLVSKTLVVAPLVEYSEKGTMESLTAELELLKAGGPEYVEGCANSLGLDGKFFCDSKYDGIGMLEAIIKGLVITIHDKFEAIIDKKEEKLAAIDAFLESVVKCGGFVDLVDKVKSKLPEIYINIDLDCFAISVEVIAPLACSLKTIVSDTADTLLNCKNKASLLDPILTKLGQLDLKCQ